MELTHFLYGLLSGVIPAILWLMFWLREDNLHPEPRSRIAKCFCAGMVAVIAVLPFQILTSKYISDTQHQYLIWATLEEIFKYLAALIVALRTNILEEPIDAMIYMITAALGFAALENAFFIMGPLSTGAIAKTIITGNLRFIGATLLHVVASGTVGMCMGLAFYKKGFGRFLALITGLIIATALHTTFNLFIISATAFDTLKIFGVVWIGVIIIILLFEKVKAVQPTPTTI
ncbi:MAG: PrsW family intramembrane metalloprotease [Candidatus Taylorbacteria bacterium]|nr:PrsW family intramembrane metalloprotease [Candidatus Taylorbacteria bacterium]